MFFYSRKLPNGTIQVKLNNIYILKPDHFYFGFMQTIVPLLQNKNQLNSFPKQFEINLYTSVQMKLAERQHQLCSICIDPITPCDPVQQQLIENSSKDTYCLKCKHIFHKSCLEEYIGKYLWFNCPQCGKMYGKMIGQMPDGIMTCIIQESLKCAGYDCGTIIIQYQLFQGEFDSQQYQSASYKAFIPNNQKGIKVVKLLQQCFRRKLTFILKRDKNQDLKIIWSQIPHKITSIAADQKQKYVGYPDQQYLQRAQKYINSLGVYLQQNQAIK